MELLLPVWPPTPPFSEKMNEQCKKSNQSRPTSGTTDVLIGFTLSCLVCEPARDSSSQNRSTWTAISMSHKASLTSTTESGPIWSNQSSTNWNKRGTTALEELAMQNKKSLQIIQMYYAYFYPLPTSHFMHDGRNMSTILSFTNETRNTQFMKIGISWEPRRPKLAAAALQLHTNRIQKADKSPERCEIPSNRRTQN